MNLFNQFKLIAHHNYSIALESSSAITYHELFNRIEKTKKQLDPYKIENQVSMIYMDKSIDFILLQLAINAVSGCFYSIDIHQKEYNEIIIDKVKPKLILVDKSLKNNKSIDNYTYQETCIFYEKEIEIWIGNDFLCPEETRYIISSSGSTGIPKFILLKDHPVIEVVNHQIKTFGISDSSKGIWLLNPSFDASLSDIYSILFAGGTLYIPDFKPIKIKKLSHYLVNNPITHMDLSPALFPLLLKEWKTDYSLEKIVFGGELASELVVKQFLDKVELFNLYGPTETTICSSIKKVDYHWKSNNIGKPILGVGYSLSSENELLIRGDHLAIGYLDNDIHNQLFFYKEDERWYKTGDIVTIENGDYFYQGRKDRQLKINGNLISPEQIESQALYCGASQSSCFVNSFGKLVLSYYGELNISFLKKNLPSYMHPHFYKKTDSISLNNNGKTFIKNE